jgi:hypothetical protein
MGESQHYMLGREAMLQLRRIVRAEILEANKTQRPRPREITSDLRVYIGYTGVGGIAAMSGATPGSGDVTLYRFTDAGTVEEAKDKDNTAVVVTAYNLSDEAVAGSTYVQLKQEGITGRLLVDYERC